MLVCLMLSQRSLRLSSILFILFSLLCSLAVISTILSSSSLIHSSASVILLLIPSRVFLISVIVLFITVGLLFSSYRSLLNDSCIFSSLFPCSFICCVFLCLLLLLNLLCLGSPFCRLQVCSSHCFWCMPPVGEVGSVACVRFLVHSTGACVLVDEAGSCLSCVQDHVCWCVLGCL